MNGLRWTTIIFLLLNGLGACFGGYSLITDATGAGMQLSLSSLRHTPFGSYLIPGIILFFVIGIGSLAVALAAFMKMKSYARLVTAEGIALTLWIIVQIIMIRTFNSLQLVFGSLGIFFILFGIAQWKNPESTTK